MSLTCLIVDADAFARDALAEALRAKEHRVIAVARGEDISRVGLDDHALASSCDVALVEISSGVRSADEMLRAIRELLPATAVIALAAHANVETAVEALRVGACDYLCRPIAEGELDAALGRAGRQRELLREACMLRERMSHRRITREQPSGVVREDDAFASRVLGSDPRMREVARIVRAVAPSKSTVLMEGESGTGKSLIAHAIHASGPRSNRAFVELSCGSIPETLLESELFGHVKGAFTGAHTDKIGRFQAADGGTLFLDEINSASPSMQLKLLRVLQERRFEPVGSTQTVEVDARVILATNQPLEALVTSGAFRQDLFYRINVVSVRLPPLRERPTDIETLAGSFLERYAGEMRRQIVGYAPEAMRALLSYHYPGNVRELQNIIERACVLAEGQTIQIGDLPEHVRDAATGERPLRGPASGVRAPMSDLLAMDAGARLQDALRAPERALIERALAEHGGNKVRASQALGINRSTLYKKMRALGMTIDDVPRRAG